MNSLKMNPLMSCALVLLAWSAVSGTILAADALHPHLKVLLCTGDFGMWAQDRVPMIEDAVAKAVPAAAVSWDAEQSFNFTKKLEDPGWAQRFDVIVMGDIAIGQIPPHAQENLVSFVRGGGGLVYAMMAKSGIPFHGVAEANPMPLSSV